MLTAFESFWNAASALTPGSLLAALALLLLVSLFILRPTLRPHAFATRPAGRRQALLVRKEAILADMRALDFDHETEKIPTEEYAQRRAELMAQAADLLRQIDELPTGGALSIDEQIEAAVAARRVVVPPTTTPITTTPVAAVPPAGPTPAPNFCSQCGRPVAAHDRFCSACGHKLV